MISSTPVVLIATERNNWCFNNIGQALLKHLSEFYQFKVTPAGRVAGDQCDVLVSMWWDYTLRCKASIRAKAVITCLYDELSWHINEHARAQFKLVLKNTHVLACCNESIAKRVQEIYKDECPPICLIEDGVDTSLFKPAPLPSKFSIGWTGNSQRATPGGPEDLKGLSIIKQAALQAGVELQILDAAHGGAWPHAEMPKFYAGVSAVIIGSAFEGTPNPLLEGLACGRPVISTRVGLAPKAVIDGKNGFLVERTPDAMARAMRSLVVAGRIELESMSREAMRAAQKWSWTVKTMAWREAITTALRVASLPQQPAAAPIIVQAPQNTVAIEPAPKRTPNDPPRVLLISDVPNWAFHVNMMDLEEYLEDKFEFDHWFVVDYQKKGYVPDMRRYDAVFRVYHRWKIDGLLPWDRTVGSLRALWFFPERPTSPGQREFNLVNQYRAFHVVTRRNYEELKHHCPNVVYLTNPVNMRRFPDVTPVEGELVASWNGNARHSSSGPSVDVKGFTTIIQPTVEALKLPFEYAEYNTQRLSPAEMPTFYRKSNVAICMSLYEGASNSVMESMASGLALITTDVGNAREMQEAQLKDFGETGIVIIDRSIEALVGAIRELQDDMPRIRQMGLINREEITRRWSWEIWADDYEEFIRKAL
jgi:glycosyltransferase involved in cell wall biosynthesis